MAIFRTGSAKREYEKAQKHDQPLCAAYSRLQLQIDSDPMGGTSLSQVASLGAPMFEELANILDDLGWTGEIHFRSEEVEGPPNALPPRTHAYALYAPNWVPDAIKAHASKTIFLFGIVDRRIFALT